MCTPKNKACNMFLQVWAVLFFIVFAVLSGVSLYAHQNFTTFLSCLDPATSTPALCGWQCKSQSNGKCGYCNGLSSNSANINGWPASSFCVSDANNGTGSLGMSCTNSVRSGSCSDCIYYGQAVNATSGVCGSGQNIDNFFAGQVGTNGLLGLGVATAIAAALSVAWMGCLCRKCCCGSTEREAQFASTMAQAYDASTGQQVYLLKADAAGYVPAPGHTGVRVAPGTAPKF